MKTIKIGIDYDEPLFPWYDNAHQVSIAAGLTTADQPPPTRWDPHSEYGCTLEEWIAVLNAEVEKGRDGMYAWPPKKDAVDAVRRAYGLGYEIHFVTRRGAFGAHGTKIKRLTKTQLIMESIPFDGLWFASGKKTATISRLGLDYFLDDRADHYFEASEAGAEAYLLDERWNRDLEVPEGRRVFSTAEYIDLIIRKHGDLTTSHRPTPERVR